MTSVEFLDTPVELKVELKPDAPVIPEKLADTNDTEAGKLEVLTEEAPEPEAVLNKDNRNVFQKMGGAARSLASFALEVVRKVPAIDRAVSRIQIAHHQHWMDNHSKGVAALKEKVTGADSKILDLHTNQQGIVAKLESLKAQGVQGLESLQAKVDEIQASKDELQSQRDGMNTEIADRNSKVETYTTKRDAVVDKWASKYESKLGPLSRSLEELKACEEETELLSLVDETRFKAQLERVDDIEKNRADLIILLKQGGMTDKEIANFDAIQVLNSEVENGRAEVQQSRLEYAQRMANIQAKIVTTEAEIKVYKDKAQKVQGMKERQPKKPVAKSIEVAPEAVSSGAGDAGAEAPPAAESVIEKGKEKMEIKKYLELFNKFITEHFVSKRPDLLIQADHFTAKTGYGENEKPEFNDFAKVLKVYFKSTGQLEANFDALKDGFYDAKIKQ
ncbi:MAG: hypothetical protein WCG97_00740 [bacterium]